MSQKTAEYYELRECMRDKEKMYRPALWSSTKPFIQITDQPVKTS